MLLEVLSKMCQTTHLKISNYKGVRMIVFACTDCDAEFTVKHSMDPDYYQVAVCPFCGHEVENDMIDDEEDE